MPASPRRGAACSRQAGSAALTCRKQTIHFPVAPGESRSKTRRSPGCKASAHPRRLDADANSQTESAGMRAEMARGAAWMVLFRLFDRSIGIVSTTVLARLLVPADFGLVAMAMSVIAIVELATAFSFEMALIQKPDPLREHFNTAWTLNILVALGGG